MTTDPELAEILAELSRREPIFHRPEFGTARADFEKMTQEDFWEVGASGRWYSRTTVLDELERRHSAPHSDIWETSEFRCRRLAPDVYLLTYLLVQNLALNEVAVLAARPSGSARLRAGRSVTIREQSFGTNNAAMMCRILRVRGPKSPRSAVPRCKGMASRH